MPECAENGIVRTGSVTTPDGFTMPFQYYLPPCYDQHPSVSYPVLYLIHGQGGDETNWFNLGSAAEIANRMIRAGEIPPLIVVAPFIDFSRATHYTDFVDVLIPHIDTNLRTLAERPHRAVGGASAGADLAACLAFLYPELFESGGGFGGGLCFGKQELIDALPAEERPRAFLDAGERNAADAHGARQWAQVLEQNSIHYLLNIGPGDHSYAYWSTNLEMYLRWCTAEW